MLHLGRNESNMSSSAWMISTFSKEDNKTVTVLCKYTFHKDSERRVKVVISVGFGKVRATGY